MTKFEKTSLPPIDDPNAEQISGEAEVITEAAHIERRMSEIERTWRQANATMDSYEGEDSWLSGYRTDVRFLLDRIDDLTAGKEDTA